MRSGRLAIPLLLLHVAHGDTERTFRHPVGLPTRQTEFWQRTGGRCHPIGTTQIERPVVLTLVALSQGHDEESAGVVAICRFLGERAANEVSPSRLELVAHNEVLGQSEVS